MIYWGQETSLLSTGLPLSEISELLRNKNNENDLIEYLNTCGEKYLQRYLIMKKYCDLIKKKEQKLPIIIVITGIPGVGKTALAKELSARFNIGVSIGGDALRSSFRALLPKDGNEILFTSIYKTWKFFGEFNQKNVISGFKAQSNIMNKAVERIIVDRGLRDGESIIIEYLHFLPTQFSEAVISHPSVIPIMMNISNIDEYNTRLKKREQYSHLRSPGERLLKQSETYLTIQSYQTKTFKEKGINPINFDNFNNGLDESFDLIIGKVKTLNELRDYSANIPILKEIEKNRE